MLVPMKLILDEAAKGNYGVAHFNVNNMEQAQAVLNAAVEAKSPVIMAASRGARSYAGVDFIKGLVDICVLRNPEIPIALHLDHGNSALNCKEAVDDGFTSVMMDGSLLEDSKTPSDFDYNVNVTREVVKYAHPFGVTVEGELGCLGGIEDGVGSGKISLTDPQQVKEFVDKTGVDALAVAVGTSHGAYKFKEVPKLAMDIISEINRLCPSLHLVMHGSSSVPQELVMEINKYGGQMPNAMGVPIESIQEGIRHGVRKVNIDTDLRLASTAAMRKVMIEKPTAFDPREFLKPAREAMKNVCLSKMIAFGSAGKIGYQQTGIDAMKNAY
jgi:fructose-bisphosphate aldolase, class II